MIEIITGTGLEQRVDYSFGSHMGAFSIPRPIGGFMKLSNESNTEFIELCKNFEGRVMTLFIDNICLYNRKVVTTSESDRVYVDDLMKNNDLLALCATLSQNKFVIFCSHEDTPIDRHIKVPENVLGIHAVNAEYFGGKIYPFPYGLQREMPDDSRLGIMKWKVEHYVNEKPNKLLYINCGLGNERNAPERAYLVNFEGLEWATTRFDKDSKHFPYDKYRDYLNELRDHKFVICPQGHGLDCHRNWETLYMRRVPVMKDHPYFRKLMQGFPVLFVKDWSDITESLLIQNETLYKEALNMNMNKLDLNFIFNTIVLSYKLLYNNSNMDNEEENADEQQTIRERRIEQLRPYQYKKGQSGNSLGRYMGGTSGKERMKRKISGMTDEEFEEFIQGISKIDLFKMAEGNPKNDMEISGELTSKIISVDE